MRVLRLIFAISLLYLPGCNRDSANAETSPSEKNISSNSRITILISAADACQPPITFQDGTGLSLDITKELNKIQDKYNFKHDVLPTKRLVKMAVDGKLHIASFSNLSWSWDKTKVDRTEVLLEDRDVFITLNKEGKNSTFFEDIDGLTKIGVMGFHYKFIDSQLPPEVLKEKHSYTGVQSEKAVIDMILTERGEVGIVSTMSLKYFMKTDPVKFSQLLISNNFDTQYDRYYVIVKESPISAGEMNGLMDELKKSGTLKKLYHKYGLDDPALAKQ